MPTDDERWARDWVNQSVAHFGGDRITDPVGVTFGDLDRGLDILAGLIQRYYPLFHPGDYLWQVTPIPPLGWLQMFAAAWLTDDFVEVESESLGGPRDPSAIPEWRPTHIHRLAVRI
jgi:hypothetical protein